MEYLIIFLFLAISDVWIALNDLMQEGQFRWALTEECETWTNWQAGRPDNWQDREHCAIIKATPGPGEWDDAGCESSRYPLCEYHP